MMSPRSLALLATAALGCHHATTAPVANPAAAADPLAATIDQLAGDAVAHKETQAVSIAVLRHGQVTFAKGYGYANIVDQRAADDRTVYRIGSLTKQFTAAAIVQLVEAGKLALADDVRKYLPALPIPDGVTVTIDQLLHHTSGMPSYTELPGFEEMIGKAMTPTEIVALIKDKPWDFPPGTKWNYSNTGYVVLGMVVEKVGGEPYAKYLHDHVIAPAGLRATGYCDERAPDPHRAAGYRQRGDGSLENAKSIDMTVPFSAGAMCSTASDLVHWTDALAHGKVVSAAGYQKMTTSHGLAGQQPYGYGLELGDLKGHRTIFHNGGINGFVSELHVFPDDDVAIAVLTNTESRAAGALVHAIARAALHVPSDAVAITLAELAAYTGVYDTPGLGDVAITVDRGQLFVQAPDQPKFPGEYRGQDTFALVEIEAKLTFVRDPQTHAVMGMIIEQSGNKIEAPKKK